MNNHIEPEPKNIGREMNGNPSCEERPSVGGHQLSWGQYLVFFITCVLVSLLFIAQVVLGVFVQKSGRELSVEEQEIQRGQESMVRWQQLAGRTYQLSQNDAGLRDVVVRQEITVKPSSSSSSSSTSSSSTSAAATTSSTLSASTH